ncbi:retinal guanylyl cyclase 1 isoform X2 [Zootermopsis nevadensis]|uniref:retinal guanylyl cyclase 1 isoform X2 n=1 Tax=Zootermopsis nevadensis TaxID=136037 RepID=UPI000B8E2906|nr:retinal guanylyl cyclase 1 isoform X2 [Zootermopsis nevadensis]
MALRDVTSVWYCLLVLVVGLLILVTAEMFMTKEQRTAVSGSHTSRTVLFLRELCFQPQENVTRLQELAAQYVGSVDDGDPIQLDILSKSAVCEDRLGGLTALLEALTDRSTTALIGSVDPVLCETVAKLAARRTKSFITWSCPQSPLSDRNKYSTFYRLVPSLSATANALVTIVSHFRWKYSAIITADTGWWLPLAHTVDLTLRREGFVVRHLVILPDISMSVERLTAKLEPLKTSPCRAIILCLPLLGSALTDNLLLAISSLRLAHLPNTTLIAVHLTSVTPFLPVPPTSSESSSIHEPTMIAPTTHTSSPEGYTYLQNPRHNARLSHKHSSTQLPKVAQTSHETFTSSDFLSTSEHTGTSPSYIRIDITSRATQTRRLSRSIPGSGTKNILGPSGDTSTRWMRYLPAEAMSQATKRAMLVLTVTGSAVSVEELFSQGPSAGNFSRHPEDEWELWQQVKEALKVLLSTRNRKHQHSSAVQHDSGCSDDGCAYRFVLLDWFEELINATATSNMVVGKWRPLLQIEASKRQEANKTRNGSRLLLVPLIPLLKDWARIKKEGVTCEFGDDDSCVDSEQTGGSELILRGAHIAAIVICSALCAAVLVIAGAVARKQLLKKRMSKGPYKILLTPSDFVFPHVADSLRVDEGIEAMLCCWLQQLQEFGGPEVDKPDLLKGSIGSLRSHPQAKSAGSTTSLARNLMMDPKARYNGDLVQLKEIPVQGAFELKSKAMDVLVTVHGLRHENLNVMIGCLTDANRPALVLEWCSRGSLEDVLVQDEIKLDWSFRLSLLTDLVRGMRYLHSTPIRVHGYLTSRNCVIDARWVLKITDYGLPAFYEAQNITPPSKTARDLLWTAPELLRNHSLLKTGTQAADVYSFGIIMQEVVVRGEPFCMLSLSPEDIIEKVKRPPPLIRPSVSKGAAPPEAINIMRQCWAEQADMRPDFNAVHDLFKKLNHGRKVNFVDTMFQMLEKYSNNLEELIRERTEQLDMEKKKTEQLLNRMLPSSVADKLKLGMPVDPEDFREVTIYFSDIVGFTTISAYSTPFEVVDLLNDLYTCFDATINAYNVYKVETIGDAYMVVGGLPVRISDHAVQIATMALDLLHQSGRFKIRHLPYTPLRLRIGLHTGPCCAGVVGLTMPRYCLFGDTVNTASRMESTGSAWRIHLSQATKEQLDQVGGFQLEYRGETDIKGKGKMHTYWLLGKAGFDKQLPTPPPIELDERLIELSRAGSSGVAAEYGGRIIPSRSEDSSSGDLSVSGGLTSPSSLSDVKMKLSPDQKVPVPATRSSEQQPDSNSNNQKRVKVSASVHNEKSNSKDDLKSNEDTKSEQSELSHAKTSSRKDYEMLRNVDANKISDVNYQMPAGTGIVRSSASDHQMTSGFGVSASDVAAALLGVSTSTQSINNNNIPFRGSSRHRRGVTTQEEDLSSPYNYYRCLSPSEQHLNQHNHYVKPIHGTGGSNLASNRFLKRQFSLDRGDEPSVHSLSGSSSVSTMTLDSAASVGTPRATSTGRLFKQNSAGAAHDLERIEEIPLVNTTGGSSPRSGRPKSTANASYFRQRCELPPFTSSSMSVSVESLN